MKSIEAVMDGEKYVFQTNKNGTGLFVGNVRISSESGFNSLSRTQRFIRAWLTKKSQEKYPRIQYNIPNDLDWVYIAEQK